MTDLSGGAVPISEARKVVVENCLFGIDVNPLASLLASALLRGHFAAGAEELERTYSGPIRCLLLTLQNPTASEPQCLIWTHGHRSRPGEV